MSTNVSTVLQYLQQNAGRPVPNAETSAAVGLTEQQVSMAISHMTRSEQDFHVARVSMGIYQYIAPVQDESRWHEVPPGDSPLAKATRRVREAANDPVQELPSVHDWSKMRFVNGTEPPKFLRVLGTDRKGLILIQMPDGTVGRVEPL